MLNFSKIHTKAVWLLIFSLSLFHQSLTDISCVLEIGLKF